MYERFWWRIRALGYLFSTRSSHLNGKGKDGTIVWQHQTKGETSITYFGSPFCIEKSSIFECSQGPKYYKSRKENQSHHISDHVINKKKHSRTTSTKKLGCPAYFKVRRISYYPDFTVAKSSSWRDKAKVLDQLHEALNSTPESIRTLKRYYIAASGEEKHSHIQDVSHLTQEKNNEIISNITISQLPATVHSDITRTDTDYISNIAISVDNYETVQQNLREELKEFINRTYFCSDTNVLAEALRTVKESLAYFTNNLD